MQYGETDYTFLPLSIQEGILNSETTIWELRLRVNAPVVAESQKGRFFLAKKGLTLVKDKAIAINLKDIEEILLSISGQALYRISEAMKSGAVYTQNGIRIGICGKAIKENNELLAVSDITSLCIRFPFMRFDNAPKFLPYLMENETILSSLILSPPAGGKTTLLRDFARYFSNFLYKNVFVVDERSELCCGGFLNGIDCFINYSKTKVLPIAMQSLHPDIVICDEIMQKEEYFSLLQVVNGGVTVFASAHGNSFENYFSVFPEGKSTFQRFILLQKAKKRTASIYDSTLNLIATVPL